MTMPVNNLTDGRPWALTETSAPSTEPLTTAEAKQHFRVDHDEEDSLIDRCVTTARQQVESFTRRALINTTFTLKLDAFPHQIRPPRSPLSSVSSVTYLDTNGDSQTLSTDVYGVDTDTEPGRIYLKYNQVWPDTREIENAVTVTFVAGYGSATTSIPTNLLSAVALLAAHYYEFREPVIAGAIPTVVPMGIDRLLWPFRVMDI